jgi:hypothetical protein
MIEAISREMSEFVMVASREQRGEHRESWHEEQGTKDDRVD